MPLARTVARRIRSGVRRRLDHALERVGLRAPTRAPAAEKPVSPFAHEPAPVVAAPVAAAPVAAAPVAAAPVAEPVPAPDTAGPPLTRSQVEALFEDMVRPALQSDGGDITLVKVEHNDVYVQLTGACHTCPSSVVTMQNGIERLLREEFPQFGQLIRVDDPNPAFGH